MSKIAKFLNYFLMEVRTGTGRKFIYINMFQISKRQWTLDITLFNRRFEWSMVGDAYCSNMKMQVHLAIVGLQCSFATFNASLKVFFCCWFIVRIISVTVKGKLETVNKVKAEVWKANIRSEYWIPGATALDVRGNRT